LELADGAGDRWNELLGCFINFITDTINTNKENNIGKKSIQWICFLSKADSK
jgi:hypothetical protein